MLSFHALFITEVCFGRLPQVAAIKHLSNFYLFPVSLSQVGFVLVLTTPTHKARNRYPEMLIARTYKD